MPPQQPQQLDPDVVRLAKALRKIESGDNFQARGGSGEYGGYQYTPATWVAHSRAAGVNVPLEQASREDQNKVFYTWAKAQKDSGKNIGEIASMHNAGEGRPNAYLEGNKGVNKYGVEYDTKSYAEKVALAYQELKRAEGAGGGMNGYVTPPQVEGVSHETTAPQEAEKPGGFLGNIARGIASPVLNILARPGQLAARAAGYDGKLSGEFKPFGMSTGIDITDPSEPDAGFSETLKDVGRGAQTVALGIGGGATKGLAGSVVKGRFAQGLKYGAQGAGAGALGGGGMALEEGKGLGGIATGAAIGGALGGAVGVGAPIIGAALRTVAPIARGTKGLATRAIEGVDNAIAESQRVAALPAVERTAVRAGIEQPVIDLVNNSSPATKRSFEKMLDVHKRAVSDYTSTEQAKQVPARTFLKYVDTIQKGSNKAAANLKKIAAEAPNERVDFTPAFEAFVERLRTKGITLDPKTGKFTSTGKIPSGEMKYYDGLLKEIQAVTRDNPQLTRMQAHRLRQRLYETLDSATRQGGKPGERPFGADVDADVNELRASIAKLLGSEYQVAAKEYATNEAVLREVAKMAGTTIDKLSTKDLKLAEVLMRALGNASDRPTTLINNVLEAAQRNGAKIDEDIFSQLRFADILENTYGSTQTRSLRGQVGAGVSDASTGLEVGAKAASGNLYGAVMDAASWARGKGNDAQIKAFEDLIRNANRTQGGLVQLPVR